MISYPTSYFFIQILLLWFIWGTISFCVEGLYFFLDMFSLFILNNLILLGVVTSKLYNNIFVWSLIYVANYHQQTTIRYLHTTHINYHYITVRIFFRYFWTTHHMCDYMGIYDIKSLITFIFPFLGVHTLFIICGHTICNIHVIGHKKCPTKYTIQIIHSRVISNFFVIFLNHIVFCTHPPVVGTIHRFVVFF